MLVGFAKNLLYNGLLLKDFQEQTEEMCITAVKQNGMALQFVNYQTDEICLKAVRQNGMALKYVKRQTEKICTAAYKQNEDSIIYVKSAEIRKKLTASEDTLILHPDMDLDDVIETLGKSKTVRPASGSFADATQQKSR